jgi:RsmE family RNA methyltransferase
MYMKKLSAHQFALWSSDVSTEKILVGQRYAVVHKDLIMRIISILRLRVGEICILFDRMYNIQVQIVSIESKSVITTVLSVNKNIQYTPYLTVLLPVLKKDDLSTAVADLTAVGVSVIQLVTTETVQRAWGGKQEYDRLERVMIAAAEQSKNFAIPVLKEPRSLLAEASQHSVLIYGDSDGIGFKSVFKDMPTALAECALLVGPESDLSVSEKEALQRMKAVACSLTPTVLRAHLAIAVMAAGVRSWYHRT